MASGRLGEAKIRHRMVSAMNPDLLGEAWRRYNAVLESGAWSSRRKVNRLLCLLPREVRRLILGVYAGHKGRSNPYDLGLISVAAARASSDMPSGMATKDWNLLKAAESLLNVGYNVEVWLRPWEREREVKELPFTNIYTA